METVELEAQVYNGLSTDPDLVALLGHGVDSIFHLQAPADLLDRYPILVYSPISDVPTLVGDDVEVAHRVTIRVYIVTQNGQYRDTYRHVHRVMTGLGFSRVQTTPYKEDDQQILIVDYVIGVSAEWQQ
jgi:hypothetical protein